MATKGEDYIPRLFERYGELKVLDDIIQHRKADENPGPILAYPKTDKSITDYEYFTAVDLDRLIDGAVKGYIARGLGPSEKKVTVGLLAASNLDFVVTFFALTRMGHAILTISPRLPAVAVANLLEQTECSTVIYGPTSQIQQTIGETKQLRDIRCFSLLPREVYDVPLKDPYQPTHNRDKMHGETCVVIHSSGSTGLPKAINLSHRAMLMYPIYGHGLHNFNALPLCHVYGLGTFLQAMYFGKTAHMWNAALPITAEGLIQILDVVRPGALHTVPYLLGLMASSDRGVELLKLCKIVSAGGARTPDEVGDKLVTAGVKLGTYFGMTEAGILGDSLYRPDGDDDWAYIRINPSIRKYVYFDRVDEAKQWYEAVFVNGHPALSASNTDFPVPGSWRSKDIFSPHPVTKDAWKYITRVDDRITLINGEKVLPLPIEGRIRLDPLIRDAAVCGISKEVPGLLIFRAEAGDHLSQEEYLNAVWPSVADANSRAEAFSQIARDMIALIPSHVQYPHTDKNSIIRAQVYEKFAKEIEALYAKEEAIGGDEGKLRLNQPELESFLVSTIKTNLGLDVQSDSEFFASGVDSLKAIQLRRVIQENIALNGSTLPQNVVYNCGNVKNLAQHLVSLSAGVEGPKQGQDDGITKMIEKYAVQKQDRIVENPDSDPRFSVILTGATGSIGAHLLAQLVALDEVKTVYCFCRGQNPILRVLRSLRDRKINSGRKLKPEYWSKITTLTADVNQEDFGLDKEAMAMLKQEVGLIIHGAWPVNFNIPLASFEQHISGLNNLIRFSLDVNRSEPAQIFFCSSISVALGAPPGTVIPDAPVKDLSYAGSTGYAQSKLVGEQIILDAAKKGANAFNVRIGQIVGDTEEGVWNDTDSYPLIIRAATVMKVMPDIPEVCEWLPVDTLASGITQISRNVVGQQDPPRTFNFINTNKLTWADLLNELRKSGLQFQTVSFEKWLEMLRESSRKGEITINPAIKLIDYFAELYGKGGPGAGSVQLEVKTAKEYSTAMKTLPDIAEQGLVRKFLSNWLPKWESESAQ